jgi:hypothetical protein
MRACVGLALVGIVVGSQGACSSSSSDSGTSKDGGSNPGTPAYDLGPDGGVLAPLAQVTIIEVAGFQSTKSQIVTTTPIGPQPITPTPLQHPMPANAPVIALRQGQIRLYIDPTNGGNTDWTPHELTAELDVFDSNGNPLVPPMGSPTHVDEKVISTISTDGDLSSTFNFLMEPQDLPAGAQFTVTVRDKTAAAGSDSDVTMSAIYPQPGQGPNGANFDDMNVKSSGQSGFQYQIVPVQYEYDGSGRLPDLTDATLSGLAQQIMELYPVDQVTYTVHAPLVWSVADGVVSPTDQEPGWDNLLQAVEQLHQTDHAPDNVWYVASIEPGDNFDDYCAEGCILGIGGASFPHVAEIAGYGLYASTTLPQELAHSVGEAHAPCPYNGQANAPAAQDPAWPSGIVQNGGLESQFPTYANARIGQFGYDIFQRVLFDPMSDIPNPKYREYMSYCIDAPYIEWTSDYTFNRMFGQISVRNGGASSFIAPPAVIPPTKFRYVNVSKTGELHWGRTVTFEREPVGTPYHVSFLAADGHTMVSAEGKFGPLDGGSGVLLVPEPPSGFAEMRVDAMPGLVTNRLAATKK